MERREAADLLEVKRIEKEEGREGGERTETKDRGAGEWKAAKEAQVYEWVFAARLIEQEGDKRRSGEGKEPADERGAPTRTRTFDDRVR